MSIFVEGALVLVLAGIAAIVVALGIASLATLPYLLRREQLDWRAWLRRVWPRR